MPKNCKSTKYTFDNRVDLLLKNRQKFMMSHVVLKIDKNQVNK